MDYRSRPAIRRSLRRRRPPARFADCMVRECAAPPPPSSPKLAVSDPHQTQYGNPSSRPGPCLAAHQPSQHDLVDMDVKQEILGLKGMLGEMMSKMSQLVVSSKHSEFSESFDDASDDDNAFATTSIVQELSACIKNVLFHWFLSLLIVIPFKCKHRQYWYDQLVHHSQVYHVVPFSLPWLILSYPHK